MKRKRIRDIYFNQADDRNLLSFTVKFLESGLLWIYIAVSPEKEWGQIYDKLAKNKNLVFRNEYNKAYLICYTYKELSKLFLGKALNLKNLFMFKETDIFHEKFVKLEKADELRWKEVIELIA